MNEDFVQRSNFEKLKDVYNVARTEHADASQSQRIALAATLGGLAFEWGTGNEAMLGFVGGQVHGLTHNAVVTGMAAGAATFAEQGAISVLMATTIYNFPNVANAIQNAVHERKRGNEDELVKVESRGRRFAGLMLLGSSVKLALENVKTPRTKSENIKRALGGSAIIACANTAFIGSMSGVLRVAEAEGFEQQAEVFVDVASNPLTYIGIISTVVGYNKVKRWLAGRRQAKTEDVPGVKERQG